MIIANHACNLGNTKGIYTAIRYSPRMFWVGEVFSSRTAFWMSDKNKTRHEVKDNELIISMDASKENPNIIIKM